MCLEPRRDPQFGVAVHRGSVDVVDAVLEQERQQTVGCLLIRPGDARRAEDDARAVVSGPAVGRTLDHAGIVSTPGGSPGPAIYAFI